MSNEPLYFIIKLTYFRLSGKYEAHAKWVTTKLNMFEIFDEIKDMMKKKILPSLVIGHSDYIVHVNASRHPKGYPALLFPESMKVE